jgi:hypothetical protein
MTKADAVIGILVDFAVPPSHTLAYRITGSPS